MTSRLLPKKLGANDLLADGPPSVVGFEVGTVCNPKMALMRLVMGAIDWCLAEMAMEKRSNGTMCNDSNVTCAKRRADLHNGINYPALRIARRFPAFEAVVGTCKECISRSLELIWWQKAGRGAVILVKVWVNLDLNTQGFRKDCSGLLRFAFCTCPNLGDVLQNR